jgi:hypothetical protein
MECIVPEERIDAVLQVILKDWKLALATFDFKDQARDFLGTQLPEFQEVASIEEVIPVAAPLQDWQIVDRTNLNPTALTYLAVKDQHPDALLLQRSISSEYYQAFFADAETIATALDMVIVRKDLGAEKRTAAMLLPARSGPMQRFVGTLEEKGFPVVLDEGIHREVVQPAIVLPQNPGLKATADQARDLDLEPVAEQLGLQQDKHDKHKWRDESHIISINPLRSRNGPSVKTRSVD